MELEKMLKNAVELHVDVFTGMRELGKEFFTTAIVLTGDAGHIVALPEWARDREKHRAFLRKYCVENKALAVVFASDGWYTHHAADADIRDVPRPSDDPSRREALTITTIWPDGKASMVFKPYHMAEGLVMWEDAGEANDPTAVTEQYVVEPWMQASSSVQ